MGRNTDIYVIYDVDAAQIKNKGLNGTTIFNVKLRNTSSPVVDQYLSYVTASGTVTAANTSLTADQKKQMENVWRIETTSSDPYEAKIYSFKNATTPLGVNTLGDSPTTAGNQTYETFIVTDWDNANNKFELLAANSGTTDNIYAYLTYSSGAKVLRSSTRQHNETVASNLVGLTLEPVALSFTYKLYDLAGNLTLQGSSDEVSDLTPSLPDFMKSPLVADYYYWKDEVRSIPLTTLSNTEDNTVYVTYQALNPSDAPIKLDGTELYTFHTKLQPTTLAMGLGGRMTLQTNIARRENYYEFTLHGREINSHFDPYDVAIYSPFQNRYWRSDNMNNQSANKSDDLSCNLQNINHRFMLLNGVTDDGVDYIQIAQKRMSGSTLYQNMVGTLKYVYHNGSTFSTGQGTTEGITHTDGEEHQLHTFQPVYIYHVLNMQGKEAVTGIESRIINSSNNTPQIPDVINSPVVTSYHYYDISSFNVSNDGVYTLKTSATELEDLREATTHDIYVTYNNADINKDYVLNGSIVYNIIFCPDGLTQDYVTETTNSYLGYDAGVQYRGKDNVYTDESYKFQVNGSYYAEPSYGAMASRYIVVHSDGDKGTDDGSDDSRWSKKYLVEPALTTEEQQNEHWLWTFTGDDPYALKIHSMTDPDKYIYRNGDSGGYTVGLTLGTTTNDVRSTFMLVGRGEGDATRFNLMASGLCTGGIAPYSYQYIGRSYHNNVHRNTRRGAVLQGFNNWGWDYTYNEPLVTVKLVPQKEGDVTYVVLNKQGNEAIRVKVSQSMGVKPVIPTEIRSPYAKNFQYWTNASHNVEKTITALNDIIYVTYDADEDALKDADIDITGTDSYNLWVNGMYLYNSNGSLVAERNPSRYDDTVHEWYLKGNSSGNIDPYDVRLKSKKDSAKFIEMASYDIDQENQSFSLIADNSANEVQSFILMNNQPGRWELMAATKGKTITNTGKNRLFYLGYITNTQLLGVGSDDNNPKYFSGMDQVQVILRQPLSGVTYHIMNLSGSEAVRYTVAAAKGDALEVPEQIRSPFATNWKYWSDEACTAALTEVPDAYADIYVTYTYDDNTYSKLQIDGSRFYNMKVADKYIEEDEGAINALSESTFTVADANVTANLWAFNGTTSAGVDPYAMHLVNKAYTDVYAGAALSYVSDTETTMQMSDGETEDFRSTFFLVGNSAEGPYEMVLASGAWATWNLYGSHASIADMCQHH